ncbi:MULTISPECIES: LolA-like outer membrane lipoprotein chaperone [unclassified Nitratiruptor]|uniref:LolA-like outer membrane lipoprotein chaperone n=1 Tax=unclassified Nitratiruptor TaxID=2624044 RepID=UPI00191527A3|nr:MULTISPECIES: LolA-like outer membrane lipoprotein chaperone [unclassified Nitratiruptor]BCD60451.1 outer membrane lipoprotein carrier protein [Nitratiruptor sp. YY08-10]BCD64060.1 outer membrane lipoprotein carrier protein [Nitratiruptor sp. YY08-14]
MKKLLIIFVSAISIVADIKIESLQSHFIQQITNDQNKTITYEGEVVYKAPNHIYWKYESPIQKKIYINGKKAVIIEPEIEQAVIKRLGNTLSLDTMLQNAKKISKNRYEGVYKNKNFTLLLENSKLYKIEYTDNLGNRVSIQFIDPKQNIQIDPSLFIYKIDPAYDVIYE